MIGLVLSAARTPNPVRKAATAPTTRAGVAISATPAAAAAGLHAAVGVDGDCDRRVRDNGVATGRTWRTISRTVAITAGAS